MVMRLILLAVLLLFNYPGQLTWESSAPSDNFLTDHLGNVYFIRGHNIIKMDTGTGEVFEYGSRSLGNITSIDVSNPMQLLLFYRNFNQIHFLDNKLAPLRSPVRLSTLNIEQSLLTCLSSRGGFWVFDDLDNRVLYYNQEMRFEYRSAIINSITESGSKPEYMIEAGNILYVNIPGTGILQFDRFATYLGTIPYGGPEKFQVRRNQIIYFHEGQIVFLNTSGHDFYTMDLPPGIIATAARIEGDNLYILTGNKLRRYRVSQD